MAQNAKPWTRPGTDAGDEIVGPDGGTYVWVPPGEFMMGSDEERDNAKPSHKKRITQGFWLSKCEVSNEQYARFLNANGKNEDREGHRLYWDTWGAAAIQREADTYEPEAGLEHHPAVDVSWYGAKAYCDFYGLRLPTEAEWEYAARGPRGFTYPWGNEWDERKCLWGVESKSVLDFANVGSFAAGRSWCGARNMAGNASEWCAEVFIRGASLYHDDGAYKCRSAYRAKYRPSPSDMFHSLGFRPAVTYDVQLSEPNVESLRAEDVVIKPGMRTTIVRGDFGRLNQIKDPETGTTTSLVKMPDGRVKIVEKDSDGNVINEIEYSKEDSEKILEGAEKITITKLPDGNIGVNKCDKDGKWTGFQSLPAKEKLVSASAYDPDTGITTTSKKNPDGSCTVTKSDEDVNIIHEVTIPPSGSRATYVEAYDPKTGETTTVRRNPDGSCTVVKADKQGNVISEEVKAPRDQELAFAKLYDPETKITTTVRKNPDGFITVTRSQNWKDNDGTKHTLEVDSDGNQTKIIAHPDGTKTTTRWDAKGGETKVVTAKDGSETTIERTSDGHAIETTTRPDGTTTVVRKDHTGKVLETVKRDPGGKTVTTDSRGIVTKTQATEDDKTEMEITDTQLKEEELQAKRKEALEKLAELQTEYFNAYNRDDQEEAQRIEKKMNDHAAKTRHLFDPTEAEKKKAEEDRIRAELARAEKELEEREKEIMRKREEADARVREFEDEYWEAYNRGDKAEALRIKKEMDDHAEKTQHLFDATEIEKKKEELEDKRREADGRLRRLQENYRKANKFSYNPFEPILVRDKAKAARIKKRIDEVAEETQHLFDATEEEKRKEAEEDKIRYELAKEIRHQAHGIAKSKLAEKEVWQDTWDKFSDKELVDLEVGTIDVKDLSEGARFQDLTGKQRRAMLRYWADASARKQIILEKLADKKTTGEQRKILHNMLKRAEDEEQSAEEFIGDIDKITVLGYAGDAVIMATGGKAAQKIFKGGKTLLRGGAKAGAETAKGVGRGAAKATRRVVGDKAADATVSAAKTVAGKGKAAARGIADGTKAAASKVLDTKAGQTAAALTSKAKGAATAVREIDKAASKRIAETAVVRGAKKAGGLLLKDVRELRGGADNIAGGAAKKVRGVPERPRAPAKETRPRTTNVDDTRPRTTSVDDTKPRTTSVDDTRPKTTSVDDTRLKTADVDDTRPRTTSVDDTRPKTTKLDRTRPETAKLDRTRPETTKLDRTRPETAKAKDVKPKAKQPDKAGPKAPERPKKVAKAPAKPTQAKAVKPKVKVADDAKPKIKDGKTVADDAKPTIKDDKTETFRMTDAEYKAVKPKVKVADDAKPKIKDADAEAETLRADAETLRADAETVIEVDPGRRARDAKTEAFRTTDAEYKAQRKRLRNLAPGRVYINDSETPLNFGEFLGDGRTTTVFADAVDGTKAFRIMRKGYDPRDVLIDDFGYRRALALEEGSDGLFAVTRQHKRWYITDVSDPRFKDLEGAIVTQVELVEKDAAKRVQQQLGGVTRGQLHALDQTTRYFNRKGVAWTDNHFGNFDFVPVDEARDIWGIKIFDTGGLYPAQGTDELTKYQNARMIQEAFNLPDARWVRDWKEAHRIPRELARNKVIKDLRIKRTKAAFDPDDEEAWGRVDFKQVFGDAEPRVIGAPTAMAYRDGYRSLASQPPAVADELFLRHTGREPSVSAPHDLRLGPESTYTPAEIDEIEKRLFDKSGASPKIDFRDRTTEPFNVPGDVTPISRSQPGGRLVRLAMSPEGLYQQQPMRFKTHKRKAA